MLTVRLIVRLFRSAARIQRKRMILTVTAIAWGTIAIILLLSFGEGLKRSMDRGQARPRGRPGHPVDGARPRRRTRAFPRGARSGSCRRTSISSSAAFPEIAAASGEMHNWNVQLVNGRKALNKRVVGVHPAYGELRTSYPQPGGRYIDELDQRLKRRVVFLGQRAGKRPVREPRTRWARPCWLPTCRSR